MHIATRTSLALCLLVSFSGCAKQQSAFRVSSLTPDPEQSLHEGQRITFVVSGNYYLAEENGRMGLFVQDKENHVLGRAFHPITRGPGRFSLSVAASVPHSDAVTIGVAIFDSQQTNSLNAVPQTYRVTPRE